MIRGAWVSKREKETSLSGSENKLYQGKYISEKDTTERSNNIQRTSVIGHVWKTLKNHNTNYVGKVKYEIEIIIKE